MARESPTTAKGTLRTVLPLVALALLPIVIFVGFSLDVGLPLSPEWDVLLLLVVSVPESPTCPPDSP